MRYAVIILGILFLSLVGLVTFFYFQFEKPAQAEINARTITFNIAGFDAYNESQVITSYVATIDGVVKAEETTSDKGRILFTSLVNKTVKICNKNINNQKYYSFCYEKKLTDLSPDNNRVDLKLYTPGTLNIVDDGVLGTKSRLILNISTETFFKKPIICIKWSSHLYSVNTVFKLINKPIEYASYDKCYDLDKDFDNKTALLPINYKTTGTLDERDFIKVVFIDRDYIDGNLSIFQNGTNLGSDDIIYENKYSVS